MWRDVSTIGCVKMKSDMWSCDVFTREMLDELPDNHPGYDEADEDVPDHVVATGGEIFDSSTGERAGNIDEVYFGDAGVGDEYDITFRMSPGTDCGTFDYDEGEGIVCEGRYAD